MNTEGRAAGPGSEGDCAGRQAKCRPHASEDWIARSGIAMRHLALRSQCLEWLRRSLPPLSTRRATPSPCAQQSARCKVVVRTVRYELVPALISLLTGKSRGFCRGLSIAPWFLGSFPGSRGSLPTNETAKHVGGSGKCSAATGQRAIGAADAMASNLRFSSANSGPSKRANCVVVPTKSFFERTGGGLSAAHSPSLFTRVILAG